MTTRGLDLSENHKKDLKEYLHLMKKADDGFVECKDIPKAFAAVGYQIEEKDTEPLRELFDTNHDGRLHIDEIANNLDAMDVEARDSQLTRKRVLAAFQMFDKEENGTIREHEFLQVMTAKLPVDDFKFNKNETTALWQELVSRYSRDGDGKVNYEEFVRKCIPEDQ